MKLIPSNKKTPRIQKYRTEELKINQEILQKYQKELETLESYERGKMAQKTQEAARQTIFLVEETNMIE